MKKWQDWPIKKVKFRNWQLYVRGDLNEGLFRKSLSVVGSRRMTHYGKSVVEKFVSNLALNNTTIISGFMYGVDSDAHKICVENNGKTVAVFGCGLNVCYPPENSDLYTKILEKGGAVISEYEPEAKPHLWKFPRRNRIVAALPNLGVLVIEAGEKSGSLITAKLALRQKKKVYAVPGPITSSTSVGANELIKTGKAKMVTEPSDIIGKVQNLPARNAESIADTGGEEKICNLLKSEPLSVDEIAKSLQIDIVNISTTLSMMSLKGIIYEEGGKYYITR